MKVADVMSDVLPNPNRKAVVRLKDLSGEFERLNGRMAYYVPSIDKYWLDGKAYLLIHFINDEELGVPLEKCDLIQDENTVGRFFENLERHRVTFEWWLKTMGTLVSNALPSTAYGVGENGGLRAEEYMKEFARVEADVFSSAAKEGVWADEAAKAGFGTLEYLTSRFDQMMVPEKRRVFAWHHFGGGNSERATTRPSPSGTSTGRAVSDMFLADEDIAACGRANY